MATGLFYGTILSSSTTFFPGGQGTINSGVDATLNAGDPVTFSIPGIPAPFSLTFQGLASVPDGLGGTLSGFYATNGNITALFTSAPAPLGQTVTLSPGDFVVCFLAGTMIATPGGLMAVEALSIGDTVLTPSGQAVPVRWLGRQTVSTTFGLTDEMLPVCVAAGALGDNLPLRDLRVTPGHALLLDGVLVNAGALVNGTTITRVPRAELGTDFVVYHIETDHHEIILAEGVASETFADNASRARFDNFAEYVAMFGAEARPMQERPEPRALSARQVPPSVRARIAALAPVVAVAA